MPPAKQTTKTAARPARPAGSAGSKTVTRRRGAPAPRPAELTPQFSPATPAAAQPAPVLQPPAEAVDDRGRRRLWTVERQPDGSRLATCVAGDFVGDLSQIRRHRREAHGDKLQRGAGVRRSAPAGLPERVSAMTVGELLELAGSVAASEALIERLQQQLEAARERAAAAESRLRQFERVAGRFAALTGGEQ